MTDDFPSPAHAWLAPLIGLWDTTTTTYRASGARSVEVQGSVEKSWTMGGLYLREDLAGVRQDGEPQLGLGFLGVDARQDVYRGVWLSAGPSGMRHFEGWLEGDDIVLFGEEQDPSGMRRRFRAVIHVADPDHHVLSQSTLVAGRWEPTFEIRYTRVSG